MDHRPRKQFGQNFLKDPWIIQMILGSAKLSGEEAVFEIGPGQGVLTQELLNQEIKVCAIEVDRDLVQYLKRELGGNSQFFLFEGDCLQMDWHKLIKEVHQGDWKLIANLPYQITSPLLFEFIRFRKDFQSFTIMVQKEVAEKLAWNGKGIKKQNDGILSVLTQVFFDVTWVCTVPPDAFDPQPKVDSAVIQLVPKKVELAEEKAFFAFVRQAFQQRRKKVLSFLKKQEPALFDSLTDQEKESFADARAEHLPPEIFCKWFQQKIK